VIHSDLPPENGSETLWITSAPAPGARAVIHSDLPPENGSKTLWITPAPDPAQ
jgi:hypothetical protein